MTTSEMGPGERAAQARTRNRNRVMFGSVVVAAVLGGLIATADRNHDGSPIFGLSQMSLDPVAAVALAAAMIVALVGLPLYMFRKVDEVAVQRNMRAMSAGWMAMIGAYPAWQILAGGGLAPAPHAFGLFLVGYCVGAVTFIVLKLRY